MCPGILESVFVKQAKIGPCNNNKTTKEYQIILMIFKEIGSKKIRPFLFRDSNCLGHELNLNF
jgi:hypothetical protein